MSTFEAEAQKLIAKSGLDSAELGLLRPERLDEIWARLEPALLLKAYRDLAEEAELVVDFPDSLGPESQPRLEAEIDSQLEWTELIYTALKELPPEEQAEIRRPARPYDGSSIREFLADLRRRKEAMSWVDAAGEAGLLIPEESLLLERCTTVSVEWAQLNVRLAGDALKRTAQGRSGAAGGAIGPDIVVEPLPKRTILFGLNAIELIFVVFVVLLPLFGIGMGLISAVLKGLGMGS